MEEIMSLLLYQGSRRHLLSTLLNTFNEATSHRDEHKEREQPEEEAEKRKIDNLLKSVETADEQVKKLEFWSDVKELARKGESKGAVDEGKWGHDWQGLDASGPSSIQHDHLDKGKAKE
jgi:hypothetical protein